VFSHKVISSITKNHVSHLIFEVCELPRTRAGWKGVRVKSVEGSLESKKAIRQRKKGRKSYQSISAKVLSRSQRGRGNERGGDEKLAIETHRTHERGAGYSEKRCCGGGPRGGRVVSS